MNRRPTSTCRKMKSRNLRRQIHARMTKLFQNKLSQSLAIKSGKCFTVVCWTNMTQACYQGFSVNSLLFIYNPALTHFRVVTMQALAIPGRGLIEPGIFSSLFSECHRMLVMSAPMTHLKLAFALYLCTDPDPGQPLASCRSYQLRKIERSESREESEKKKIGRDEL